MTNKFSAITVRFDDGTTFRGYSEGETWNGWEVPWLEADEMERLRAFLAADEVELPGLPAIGVDTVDGLRLLTRVAEGLCFWAVREGE